PGRAAGDESVGHGPYDTVIEASSPCEIARQEGPPATMTNRASATTEPFDVREYARTAQGSHRGEIDVETLARTGLPRCAVLVIRVLRDRERGTLARLRHLLVTAPHKDARVTAFLATWAFEKYWLADALDAVLDAVGADTSPLTGPPRRTAAER